MTGITHAPWTPEQFTNISLWQTTPWVHQLTCGTDGCRTTLAVSTEGLECPHCDYTQAWVPSVVAEHGPPPDPREQLYKVNLNTPYESEHPFPDPTLEAAVTEATPERRHALMTFPSQATLLAAAKFATSWLVLSEADALRALQSDDDEPA